MGFPKANNSSFDNAVIYKNQHLITCEINNIFLGINLFEKENIDCKQNYKLFCDESLFDNYEIYMTNNIDIKKVENINIRYGNIKVPNIKYTIINDLPKLDLDPVDFDIMFDKIENSAIKPKRLNLPKPILSVNSTKTQHTYKNYDIYKL